MKLPRARLSMRRVSVPSLPVGLRDPGLQAAVVLAVLAVAGFVMLAMAWRGAARTRGVGVSTHE